MRAEDQLGVTGVGLLGVEEPHNRPGQVGMQLRIKLVNNGHKSPLKAVQDGSGQAEELLRACRLFLHQIHGYGPNPDSVLVFGVYSLDKVVSLAIAREFGQK